MKTNMKTLTTEQARERTRIALYESMTENQKKDIDDIDARIFKEITVYSSRSCHIMYDVKCEEKMCMFRGYYELFGYACTFLDYHNDGAMDYGTLRIAW